MSQTLSILVPAYNESKTIELILNKILNVDLKSVIQKELVIVNDCSTDNTIEVVKNYIQAHQDTNIRLYEQPINKGKGAAITSGV